MDSHRLAIFASGNGTNAEEIIKYFKSTQSVEVCLLLSNNASAFALERAKRHGIETRVFTRPEFSHSEVIVELLKDREISHIVLAGFLWLIPASLVHAYPNRIINIHPALLPKHGGKGMFGMNVHDAVLKSGDLESGITIHEVNEHYDEGRVLFQQKCVVENGFTAQDIANCVHALEYEHYPRVIEQWVQGKL